MENYSIVDNNLYQNYDYLNEVINHTLEVMDAKESIFTIIFVTPEEIHELNKQYRGVDRVTDVISFALEDAHDVSLTDVRVLGDIYICIDRMKEQALEYGHSETRELSFLTVHGLLHLLGYDHQTKEDEEVMFGLQRKILSDLNINR
ncbi:probable rRNA maturation factor [Coprobacillus sp. CAG:605]|nr:probable rRNA maturation factor [Coprobacillus sp. CAG:605]